MRNLAKRGGKGGRKHEVLFTLSTQFHGRTKPGNKCAARGKGKRRRGDRYILGEVKEWTAVVQR